MHLLLDSVVLMETFPTCSFRPRRPPSRPSRLKSAAGLLRRPVPNLFQLKRATRAKINMLVLLKKDLSHRLGSWAFAGRRAVVSAGLQLSLHHEAVHVRQCG